MVSRHMQTKTITRISLRKAAQLLGVPWRTLRRWAIDEDLMTDARFGGPNHGRKILLFEDEVEAMLSGGFAAVEKVRKAKGRKPKGKR